MRHLATACNDASNIRFMERKSRANEHIAVVDCVVLNLNTSIKRPSRGCDQELQAGLTLIDQRLRNSNEQGVVLSATERVLRYLFS